MTTDSAAVLFGERRPVCATASVGEPELNNKERADRVKEAWNSCIDHKLVEWGRNPNALEDEDFVPPERDVIKLACEWALCLRDMELAPPTMVVPDGEGGISFERVDGEASESLNIYADQTVELLVFNDCRLCGRHRLA